MKKYLLETAKYALRSYPLIRPYVNEVEKLFAMNDEELNKRNEEQFLKIFRRAYDKSPFYHKLYTEAGIKKEDITGLDDIKKLPIVTKDMVKKHAREMLTVSRMFVNLSYTSGSTGTPLQVYRSWPSIWRSQAYSYCARKRNGYTYGQPIVSLRGHLDRRKHHLKVHLSNTLFLSSYHISINTLQRYYDLIVKHKPVAIEGYPSSLYSIALLLKETGRKLSIPMAFTSSETLLDYQRALIEEQMGTEIFDRYGMTERTLFLIESNHHEGYYEAPGYSINEYVEDGEICTSLINEAFPLIRYRSNDVMEMAESTTEKPSVVVKKIKARAEDCLYCKDGSRMTMVDFIIDGVMAIKYTQLIQNKEGKLLINIVPDTGFSDADIKRIEHSITHRIGADNVDYSINLISEQELIYTSRGKYKFLINLMDTPPTYGQHPD